MASERKRFNKYVASLSQRALAKVKPLPYLRVLADAEWKEHCAAIERLWSVKGHWYPLSGNNPPPHVLPFHTDYFDQEKVDLLRGILMDRRQHRVLSLRWSIGFEIELDSFEPSYKWSVGSRFLYGAGEEAFWTNPACDFLVYASHENSITIAGAWLVEAFERAMPGCRECTYLGELSTDDLRGLW